MIMKTAIVTGASSGIGWHIALQLAQLNYAGRNSRIDRIPANEERQRRN